MYEVLDDTAAQVILAIESGDSIRRVAQHLHTPYETVRQAANRLEDAGYIHYDDGLSVVNARVRDAARELVTARTTNRSPTTFSLTPRPTRAPRSNRRVSIHSPPTSESSTISCATMGHSDPARSTTATQTRLTTLERNEPSGRISRRWPSTTSSRPRGAAEIVSIHSSIRQRHQRPSKPRAFARIIPN